MGLSGCPMRRGVWRTELGTLGVERGYERKRRPFLRLWPNGQYSLSYKYGTEAMPSRPEDEWRFLGGRLSEVPSGASPPNLVSSLESSQACSVGSGRTQEKYGLKGITRYGQKMVRSGAYLIQRRYGLRGTCFLTLTVPPLSKEERMGLAQEWGDVMRQVLQQLCRELKRAGQPPLVVSVTELQSGRSRRYREAYLHAHLVFPARRAIGTGWCVEVDSFRLWYKQLLERKIGRTLDSVPRVETKTLRSSAEHYLGKYMTKGAGDIQGIIDDLGEASVPGQQWNMSNELRSRVKSGTLESHGFGEMLQLFVDEMVETGVQLPGVWKRVEITIEGRVLTVAWAGHIDESAREYLGLPSVDDCAIISNYRDLTEVDDWLKSCSTRSEKRSRAS